MQNIFKNLITDTFFRHANAHIDFRDRQAF